MKSSLPPWYISGSVQNSGGISAPRARRTSSTWFTYAEPSAHWNARGSGAMHSLRVERKRVARAALVERVIQILQLRRVEGPVVEHALQRRRDRVGDGRSVQVAGHDDQLAVARAVLQRGKFHKGMSRVSDDRGNLFYDGESPRPK